jgi:hypothetical protein
MRDGYLIHTCRVVAGTEIATQLIRMVRPRCDGDLTARVRHLRFGRCGGHNRILHVSLAGTAISPPLREAGWFFTIVEGVGNAPRLVNLPRRRKRSRKSQRRVGVPGHAHSGSAVFENLEDGLTIDRIVELFDGLKREQVVTVLDFAAH